LELGDGYLTLGQLLTQSWRLPQLVDVFLSCCETHLGLMPITDDVLTLSSGFLCAGARSVVNTLWSVSDLATAVFSVFYYENRRRGCCRPAALQQAQEELRCLSGQTLATVYQPQIMMVLEEKMKQFDAASKQTKAFRDKEAKDSPAYLKWDEEYKGNYKAADRIRKTIPTVKKAIASACQQPLPFSSPYYWGAFTCSGLR
jgi:CHAT domain-containing protein